MPVTAIKPLLVRQRQYFADGHTRRVAFRVTQLKTLRSAVKAKEPELLAALRHDLGKGDFEGYTSEVGFVYEAIDHALRHLRGWTKPRRVGTPLLLQPSTSMVYPQPKGVVLIIGPWNYPLQLLLAPLVGAIAAGNCAVLKPSEIAGATAAAVAGLIEAAFPPEFCAVVEGGVSETTALLAERFDHLFFTGSLPVGRIVMRAAAEHLTPVTLELGGKSPCLVDQDVDLAVAARRITWGKFYNAGQTCIAPDYLLVPKRLKGDLLAAMQRCLGEFYGDDPQRSPDYARIVSQRHFDRLVGLIAGNVVVGGRHDRESLYIAPTIVDQVHMGDALMADEIFGPILPVIEYDTLDEALSLIKERPRPLACYVFTNRAATGQRVIDEVAFGGGCINNVLVHCANPNLPFGGIGESGMGAYHGQASFQTFSHYKAVVKSSFRCDLKLKYPPYRGLGLIKKLMR